MTDPDDFRGGRPPLPPKDSKGWQSSGRPFDPLPSVVMYGMPPEQTPRDPNFVFDPTEFVHPGPALKPCPTCKRHIYIGTTCPFCYAESVAKASSRATLEAMRNTFNKLIVSRAAAMDIVLHDALNSLEKTLEEKK